MFDLEKVVQGHGVQHLQWHHSVANIKDYNIFYICEDKSNRILKSINIFFTFMRIKVTHTDKRTSPWL